MPSGSRNKRKVYGAVRDFDEIFCKRSRSEYDKDFDRNDENNSASSSDQKESDFHPSWDDDTNKYECDNIDTTNKNKKCEKKKSSAEDGDIKIRKKQGTKRYNNNDTKQSQCPEKESIFDDIVNDVTVKVKNDAGDNEAGTGNKQRKDIADPNSFDVVLSSSMITGAPGFSDNQCTLLVEVSFSRDATSLGEFGGSIGAIGRFESDPRGITLDLKGNQYRGSLLPGPSCLIIGFPQSFGIKKKEQSTGPNTKQIKDDEEEAAKLRVEGIADEYTTLVQIDDHMKKLDAVVTLNKNDSNNRVTKSIGDEESSA